MKTAVLKGCDTTRNVLRHVVVRLSVIPVLLVTLLVSACGNEIVEYIIQPDSGQEKMNVTFKVSKFEQIPFVDAFATKASLSAVCTKLHFAIYKDGVRDEVITQDIDDEQFGFFCLKLSEGSYPIIIVAHNGDGNASLPTSIGKNISFSNKLTPKFTDTFYYCDTINVTKNSVSFDIELKRAISKFSFTIDDDVPERVKSFQIDVFGCGTTLNPLNGFSAKGSLTAKNPAFTIILPVEECNKKLETCLFPCGDTTLCKFVISALDADGSPIKSLTVENVPMSRNRITTCHSELFGGSFLSFYDMSFLVAVKEDWDQDIVFSKP